MLRWVLLLLGLVLGAGAIAQEEKRRTLPNGKSQTLALVKDSHERSLENVDEIRRLAEELTEEMERATEHVVSLEAIKKLERIEKLARNVRDRMRRTH